MADTPFLFLIYVFDLFGPMAFAVTGAFKAIEHKSDIVGILILSIITGVAGGTIRDIVIGRFPPNSIVDPLYVGNQCGVRRSIVLFVSTPAKALESIFEI